MPKVLVTGSTGLVGGEIVRHLHSLGWEVIMATSSKNVIASCDRISVVDFQLSNISSNQELKDVLKSTDVIVHCAAVLPGTEGADNRQAFELNTRGTLQLLELSSASNLSHFIFLSTANMFESSQDMIDENTLPVPDNYYALSKCLCEQMLKGYYGNKGLKYSILRISAPYGSRYKIKAVIPLFVERALKNKDLELMGTGLREQTFTYVTDIARACEMVIQKKVQGCFNITGPAPVTMKMLAETVLKSVSGTRSKIVMTEKPDPLEQKKRRISIDYAKKTFGYEPRFDLSSGLSEMVRQMMQTSPSFQSVA
jgi:nucleoside-diphosphate-sugar epimerase